MYFPSTRTLSREYCLYQASSSRKLWRRSVRSVRKALNPILFTSSWQIHDARHISRLVGELRTWHCLCLLPGVPPFLAMHASHTFLTPLVTMTIVTALLQASSLISSLSQLRTNGKHSSWLFQINCVIIASKEKMCLQYYPKGGSNLGTFAAPKLPQFLENK